MGEVFGKISYTCTYIDNKYKCNNHWMFPGRVEGKIVHITFKVINGEGRGGVYLSF